MCPKRFFIYSFLFASLLLSSCNYFQVEKVNRYDIKKSKLESIKKQSLHNYPEIYACDNQEDSKICFERQINKYLDENLDGVLVDENEVTEDTLWLTVSVSKIGKLSLKPFKGIDEEYAYLFDTIQNALDNISPIKPAFTNDGITVTCNFKLPLVIKNIE